jgi:glycosyltransferase involved in cell wall biosynthesis
MSYRRCIQKRPELLILCQLFYPELVSTGQTLTELAEKLAASGVDVEVLSGPPTILGRDRQVPKQMTHRGIRIRRVWGTRFPKLSLLGRIVNQMSFTCSVFFHLLIHRPKRPILVLTNPPFLAIICAVLRVVRIGPPYLYLIFDVYPDTAVRLGLLRAKSLLVRIWDYSNIFVYERASAVVVIGRCMKDMICRKIKEQGHDIDGKLYQIHVWCDDEAIMAASTTSNGLAARFDVRNRFVVGYFGNMGRFHDIETILEAAERLKSDRRIVFLFVGEGHKKRWAMEYARQHGLENCRFQTYVEREELGHLLALADLGLVSLSDGQEGLSVPSKTFGLMAARVPVLAVVPEACEIARIVKEEGCGVWVRPGDAGGLSNRISELSQDSRRLQVMGENGLRAIQDKYSVARASQQYLDLLLRVSMESRDRDRPAVPHTNP